MDNTLLYVEKDTDSMRSVFTAIGLAHLFFELPETDSGVDVAITDKGSAIQLTINLSREEIIQLAHARRLPLLLPAIHKPLSAGEKKQLEAGELESEILRRYIPIGFPESHIVDYGAEKSKEIEARKDRKEDGVAVRPLDYPLWAHLCSYFGKGSAMRTGYPLVVHAWYAHRKVEHASEALLRLILDCYGTFPNTVSSTAKQWAEQVKPHLNYPDFALFNWKGTETDVSALSVVSPTTAQGSYTDSGARIINTATPTVFWLELYLALAGYMQVGLPYRAGNDVLLYYPLPRDIKLSRLRDLMHEYRDNEHARNLYDYSGFFPRAKIDALSQISFYLSMVKHFQKNVQGRRRVNAISGLVGYYYKDISTQIPFDETTFALPEWVSQKADADQLQLAADILEQHYKIIRGIREGFAEELQILHHYRNFITLGHPDDWVEFAIAYGQHRFNKLPEQQWLLFLPLTTLEETLMNNTNTHKDYRPIFKNTGFQNIARAINACTSQLGYFKDVKKQHSLFKVQHGLGDDLRRRAHNADHFVEDLSAFVHEYLRESNSVRKDDASQVRASIAVTDLYEVIELVNIYGSRVVANLLVAAGYAYHEPKSKTDQS